MGRFLPVYNGEYTPLECLSLYRNRAALRRHSACRKPILIHSPLESGRNPQSGGMLFIFSISLIIGSALMSEMISSGLMRKYSLEKMIPELEKLHVFEDSGGNITELERTRKQKDMLETLEKVSWW